MNRVVADLRRAEQFYGESLGFGVIGKAPLDSAVLAAFGFAEGGAEQVIMHLGDQQITLIQFAIAGRPYPLESLSSDCSFQHAAIVVNDMDRAHAHLCQHAGWREISEGGPQVLPPSDGGVRAFKFRDLDGHPLELIWFPPGAGRETASDSPFLELDYSALSNASTTRSLSFYRALGFQIISRRLTAVAHKRLWTHFPAPKCK